MSTRGHCVSRMGSIKVRQYRKKISDIDRTFKIPSGTMRRNDRAGWNESFDKLADSLMRA
jgi:hypothetical protein